MMALIEINYEEAARRYFQDGQVSDGLPSPRVSQHH